MVYHQLLVLLMRAVVWRLLLQIFKSIAMVSFPSFSFSVLLISGYDVLFLVQNWRIDCWLDLMLRHRDENCLQWQNVLKYYHRCVLLYHDQMPDQRERFYSIECSPSFQA
jgi:hypothetical protein